MRFVSRVACESERDTSKDNRSFATLPLSSTVRSLLRPSTACINTVIKIYTAIGSYIYVAIVSYMYIIGIINIAIATDILIAT